MSRALHAEWTKLRTVPSLAWLPLAIAALTVAVSILVTTAVDPNFCGSAGGCDTAKLTLSGVYLAQVAVVVLAVLAMTGEYGTGLIAATLAADPHRLRVLVAKAATVTATVLGAGLLGVAGSLLAGRIFLAGPALTTTSGYPPLSLTDTPTLRAAAGTVLYLALIALLSLAVATVLRDTGATLTTVLALLYLPPILVALIQNPQWQQWIDTYAPMSAGLAVQTTQNLSSLPIGPWAGLGILAAYAGAAMLMGALLFKARDA